MFTWQLGTALLLISVIPEIAYRWSQFAYVGVTFIPVTAYHFITTSVREEKVHKKVIWLNYSIATLIFLPLSQTRYILEGVQHYTWGYWFKAGSLHSSFPVFFGVLMLMGLRVLYQGFQREISGSERTRRRYLFIAIAISCIGSVDYLPDYGFSLYPFGYLPVFTCISILAYAIVRHRLMNISLAITRTAVFMLVYAAVLGLPFFAALTWQTQLESFLGYRWWVWVLLTYAALATAAHYANMYFQKQAEERLMAEQRRYQSVLRQAAQGMILIKEMKKLLSLVVHLLTQKVRVKHAAIYLWDEKTKRFYCQAARQWPVKDPPPFAPGDSLVEYINWHRTPMVTEELYLQTRGGTKELQGVVTSLKNLQAAVLIPSFTEDRCEGFLLLGDKLSGALFTSDDLQVFQVLASQTALAIENAQFYEELKRTQTDLFQTAKMASLGHMAGGMSHQINNRFHVLTILAGTLRSVMKDSDPTTMDKAKLTELWGKAVETLSKLEDNAFRGGDIVKTLLKFSRPSGDYKLLSLAQVVKTARDVAQFRVNLASIDFREDVPENLPQVRGDMNQLADSVFNLITNAFDAISKKATMLEDKLLPPAPNDSVPFRGRLWARAYSERKDDRDFVVLEFQDNGVGMTSAELDNIFVPFFTTKATAQKGTGLGLYVIQRIVEQHGGTVNAKSKYGVGTTFTFRLPANTEAVPAIAPEEPKAKVA